VGRRRHDARAPANGPESRARSETFERNSKLLKATNYKTATRKLVANARMTLDGAAGRPENDSVPIYLPSQGRREVARLTNLMKNLQAAAVVDLVLSQDPAPQVAARGTQPVGRTRKVGLR
jgi:hypothetical protein